MGRKYQTKYNDNPPPGHYDPSYDSSKEKTRSAFIKEDFMGFQAPKTHTYPILKTVSQKGQPKKKPKKKKKTISFQFD